jgi:hypothetical protein
MRKFEDNIMGRSELFAILSALLLGFQFTLFMVNFIKIHAETLIYL